MSIGARQSLLLFMFWLNIVSMEEQLVPLNKVIEASPGSAKVRLGLGPSVSAQAYPRNDSVPVHPNLLQALLESSCLKCAALCSAVAPIPQELISHCEVVKEADLKAVLTKTYRRKKAFKRLSHAEQDREGWVLIETGSGSAAAFFDLNSLRKTSSKRRHSQVSDTLNIRQCAMLL